MRVNGSSIQGVDGVKQQPTILFFLSSIFNSVIFLFSVFESISKRNFISACSSIPKWPDLQCPMIQLQTDRRVVESVDSGPHLRRKSGIISMISMYSAVAIDTEVGKHVNLASQRPSGKFQENSFEQSSVIWKPISSGSGILEKFRAGSGLFGWNHIFSFFLLDCSYDRISLCWPGLLLRHHHVA